jgi:hypothetical protein
MTHLECAPHLRSSNFRVRVQPLTAGSGMRRAIRKKTLGNLPEGITPIASGVHHPAHSPPKHHVAREDQRALMWGGCREVILGRVRAQIS